MRGFFNIPQNLYVQGLRDDPRLISLIRENLNPAASRSADRRLSNCSNHDAADLWDQNSTKPKWDKWLVTCFYKFYCACIRTGFIDIIRLVIGLFSLMLFCCFSWMTGSSRSQSEVRQMNRYCLAGMCFPTLRARYTHFEFWFVHTIVSWSLWLIRVISLNNSNTSQLAVIWHASCWLQRVSTVLRTVNWQITVQISRRNSLKPKHKRGKYNSPRS